MIRQALVGAKEYPPKPTPVFSGTSPNPSSQKLTTPKTRQSKYNPSGSAGPGWCEGTPTRPAIVFSLRRHYGWKIEGGFLDLTTNLDCEINTLCYPRAALLVFCVALLAYNLHSTIKGVMRSEQGAEKVETDLSPYFVSSEIGQVYRGMMVALPPEEWVGFRDLPLQEYIAFLKKLASKVDFRDTRRQSEPKKQRPNAINPQHPHISVAKILLARKLKETG